MHLLHLLRHAKSSSRDDLADYERRLNSRGREAARRIGRRLPADLGNLDLVLCSSAARTRETLEFALERFQTRPRCVFEEGLYLADCEKLVRRLQQLDESTNNVLLIGHNPGLHRLAVALAKPDSAIAQALASSKFPTLARASFEIVGEWSKLGEQRHRITDYVTPRSMS